MEKNHRSRKRTLSRDLPVSQICTYADDFMYALDAKDAPILEDLCYVLHSGIVPDSALLERLSKDTLFPPLYNQLAVYPYRAAIYDALGKEDVPTMLKVIDEMGTKSYPLSNDLLTTITNFLFKKVDHVMLLIFLLLFFRCQ